MAVASINDTGPSIGQEQRVGRFVAKFCRFGTRRAWDSSTNRSHPIGRSGS